MKDTTKETVTDLLGNGWLVLALNEKLGKWGAHVAIDPGQQWYQHSQTVLGVPLQRVVIIASYTELSNLPVKDRMDAFFHRNILDEGHENRRSYLSTQRGKVLQALNAPSRWVSTGTPIVNSLVDIYATLFFLERPWWSADVDRNRTQRYVNWKTEKLQTPGKAWQPAAIPEPNADATLDTDESDWEDHCSSVEDMEDVQRKIRDEGWLCSHWPACEAMNGREDSVASHQRLGVLETGNVAQNRPRKKRKTAVVRPFRRNPYNFYHARSASHRKALTFRAVLYWIITHLPQKGDPPNDDIQYEKIRRWMMCVLKPMAISRNAASTVVDVDGTVVTCGADIPAMKILTQVLKFSPEEQKYYEAREKICGRNLQSDLGDVNVLEKVISELLKKAPGRKFRQVFILTTSLLFFAFRTLKPKNEEQVSREGLPALIIRLWSMANGIPDHLKQQFPKTEEEILRIIMWGSPKFRWGRGQVLRVCYSDAFPASHRKLINMFHWPFMALVWYKVSFYIGRCGNNV
jgi:hypothetical protein